MCQKILLVVAALAFGCSAGVLGVETEQWDIFELTLKGPSDGNPFADVRFSAEFRRKDKVFKPEGFYDGNGIYKVRFMPDAAGKWTYVTRSNRKDLDGKKGHFTCTKARSGNHGPVRVHNTFHFAYADGTAYRQIGTTCYAWVHQGDAMEEKTLATLKKAPFNKMRMCIFPKDFAYNKNEPVYYAYEGKPLKDWDFTRFNPAFWRHFEKRVGQLRDMGIEADIIIFHPYDRWGFKKMGHENNLFYLRYLVARLAAYRNVWWSFANEFGLLKWPMEHWDQYMQLVQQIDPYDHLRGIHNYHTWYDHTKPWVTHCSVQDKNFRAGRERRRKYRKPIIYDECRYEGGPKGPGFGRLTGQEMTWHFWLGTVAGCYVGHGETYPHPQDLLWWAKGGVLYGDSPVRIAFLKKILEEGPPEGLDPIEKPWARNYAAGKEDDYYLFYFGTDKPTKWTFELPEGKIFQAEVIDTWNMTIVPKGTYSGNFTIDLPGKPYIAVRILKVQPKQDYAIRLTRSAPGEKGRSEAKATVDKSEGIAPLTVKFSTPWKQKCHWDFGDGATSTETNPTHTYERFGRYAVTLTVTDSDGGSGRTALSIGVLPAAPKDLDKLENWPGSHSGLVFVWANNEAGARVLDDDGGIVRTCRIKPRGNAKIGRRFDMEIGGGAFLAEGVNNALLDGCKQTNQLTVEAVITPASLDQRGPARIVSFSKDHTNRNFTLGQEGDALVIRIRTPKTGANGLNPQLGLCKLEAGKAIHVIVSYFPGVTTCYVDGAPVFESDAIQGDFSNWEACQLLFGDEVVGKRSWSGRIEGVSISSRHTGPEEAARKHTLYREQFMNR